MSISISVQAGREFEELPRKLRDAAASTLRREMDQAVTRAVRGLPQAIKASALSTLPRRGGLGTLTANTPITTSNTSSVGSVSFRITASSRRGLSGLAALDRGTARHPLFGNRGHWYTETVQPGWWTKPTQKVAATVRSEIERAMDTVAQGIL